MLVTVTLVRASFSRFSVSGPEIEEFVDKGQLRIDLKAASINVACIPQVTCPVDERDPDEFDFDLLEPCLEPYRLIVHLTRNTGTEQSTILLFSSTVENDDDSENCFLTRTPTYVPALEESLYQIFAFLVCEFQRKGVSSRQGEIQLSEFSLYT